MDRFHLYFAGLLSSNFYLIPFQVITLIFDVHGITIAILFIFNSLISISITETMNVGPNGDSNSQSELALDYLKGFLWPGAIVYYIIKPIVKFFIKFKNLEK